MNKQSRIYVAGHNGMVGSSIARRLTARGYDNLIFVDRSKLDLLNQQDTFEFIKKTRPEYIFLAAAKVGGIQANNTFRADFIYENLMVQCNLINAAYKNRVSGLCFLGSSCIYPKDCPQPIKEEYLLTGPLELTNEPYAVAKIAGIKLCESFNRQYKTSYLSVMPTNLFGPNDNYDLETAHVLPSLLRKFHEAKVLGLDEVVVWGTGEPRREFMYVDDLADACLFLMEEGVSGGTFNVGYGIDMTIEELARSIQRVVGFSGKIVFDYTKPNGTMRKLLDSSKIRTLGWGAKTDFEEGLRLTYSDFLSREY